MRRRMVLVTFLSLCSLPAFPVSGIAWDAIVDTIWTVIDSGGRVDWSPLGENLIAFDRMGPDSLYDVYLMNPEGSGVVCLTDRPGLIPQKNNGQPAWHPSGQYIVFQMEKDADFDPNDVHFWPSELSTPDRGWNCDLWCVDLEDTAFYRLTNLPTRQTLSDTTPTSGVLQAHFSPDGSKLFWSELLNGEADLGNRGDWGQWRLNLSSFLVEMTGPRLGVTEHFERGFLGDGTFFESHDFSADDRMVLFSGNLMLEQHQAYLDIYSMDILTDDLYRLTFTTDLVWDQHAHFRPNGGQVVWASSQGYSFTPESWSATLRTDYWLMAPNGYDKRRLTFFNDPAHPEYTGDRVIVADCSWSPEGDRLIAGGLFDNGQVTRSKIFMVELARTPVEENTLSQGPQDCFQVQNHPNPFNSQTAIRYRLPRECHVRLSIYNALGQCVEVLVDEHQMKGSHAAFFSAGHLTSGVYLYRLNCEDLSTTGKMVLLN